MESTIREYLRRLRKALGLDADFSPRILVEIEDHLLEAAEGYLRGGLSQEDAEMLAVQNFGPPELVADALAEEPVDVVPSAGGTVLSYERATRKGGSAMVELELVGVRVVEGEGEPPKPMQVRTEVGKVVTLKSFEPVEGTPLMVLRDPAKNRHLFIYIGLFEATSIAFGLSGVKTARPMTHDFIANILGALPTVVPDRVVITRLVSEGERGGTFYAQLELRHGDATIVVDCRPSDGVALAARLNLPIYADTGLEDAFVAA